MNTPTSNTWQVPPPGQWPYLTLAALTGLPALAILVGISMGEYPRWQQPAVWAGIGLPLALFALLAWLMRRRSIALHADTLVVKASWYTRRTPLASLRLDQARVLDLDEHAGFKPRFKRNGISLPGFHAGWFSSRAGHARTFCLLTDNRRVLFLPTSDGRPILVSLESPRDTLQALRGLRESDDGPGRSR